jgi:hypothetical protein
MLDCVTCVIYTFKCLHILYVLIHMTLYIKPISIMCIQHI